MWAGRTMLSWSKPSKQGGRVAHGSFFCCIFECTHLCRLLLRLRFRPGSLWCLLCWLSGRGGGGGSFTAQNGREGLGALVGRGTPRGGRRSSRGDTYFGLGLRRSVGLSVDLRHRLGWR